MTKTSLRITLGRSMLMVASLLAAGAASAGATVQESADNSFYASAPTCARHQLSGLDARVVAKASEGIDSLRDFVFVSQKINGLDMNGTIAWLDRQRAAEAACNAAVAMARR